MAGLDGLAGVGTREKVAHVIHVRELGSHVLALALRVDVHYVHSVTLAAQAWAVVGERLGESQRSSRRGAHKHRRARAHGCGNRVHRISRDPRLVAGPHLEGLCGSEVAGDTRLHDVIVAVHSIGCCCAETCV